MVKNFSEDGGTLPTVMTDLAAEQQLSRVLSSGDVRFQPVLKDDWRAEGGKARLTGEGFMTVARSVSCFPKGPQRAARLEQAALELNGMFGIHVDEATSRIENAIRQNLETEQALEAIGVIFNYSK